MSLTHITTCLLCDPLKPKKFACESIPQVRPGEQPPEAVLKFFNALGAHLAKEHPQALASVQQMGAMLQALILLKNFSTTDPGVHSASEVARQFIHRLTLQGPHVLSEAWLQDLYRSMLDDSPTGTIRFEEFQRLRDLLLEEGTPAEANEPIPYGIAVTAT